MHGEKVVTAWGNGIAYQARKAAGRESCLVHAEEVCAAGTGVIELPTCCLCTIAGEDEGGCERDVEIERSGVSR
jgi:hypothetical protein